jgi:hypothetical protein
VVQESRDTCISNSYCIENLGSGMWLSCLRSCALGHGFCVEILGIGDVIIVLTF